MSGFGAFDFARELPVGTAGLDRLQQPAERRGSAVASSSYSLSRSVTWCNRCSAAAARVYQVVTGGVRPAGSWVACAAFNTNRPGDRRLVTRSKSRFAGGQADLGVRLIRLPASAGSSPSTMRIWKSRIIRSALSVA